MSDKIVRLAVAHDGMKEDKAAVEIVVRFLREHADAIERGDDTAHKAVLVLYENAGSAFRVISKGCNVSAVERVGIMQLALHDFCAPSTDA